ncbi:MAG: hypothetical protein WC785_02420 [Tatlockia sp.]|jgi:hypothetical protein
MAQASTKIRNQKLTDNQLNQLIQILLTSYRTEFKINSHVPFYERWQNRVVSGLGRSKLALAQLPLAEQQKIGTTIETFLQACPEYTTISKTLPTPIYVFPLECLAMDYLVPEPVFFPTVIVNEINGVDRSGSSFDTKDCTQQTLLFYVILLVAAIAFALTLLSLYYLLSQTLNGVERIWHNEGFFQGVLPVLSGIAAGTAAGLVSGFLFTGPLIAIAIAAGLSSPIGFAIFGGVCFTMMAAGLTCFITKQVQDNLIYKKNPDALDAKDPHRFEIKEGEKKNLLKKGFDPTKVMCVIALLHDAMGKDRVPSLVNRLFTKNGQAKQEHLELIRKLRRGDLPEEDLEVKLGEHTFQFNLHTSKTSENDCEGRGVASDTSGYANTDSYTPSYGYSM